MSPRTARRPENQWNRHVDPADSVHGRHPTNEPNGSAWSDGTEPAMRLVGAWKRAVRQAELELVRFGSWFALLDVVGGFASCFVPMLSPLIAVARLGAIAVLGPALLRTLAIRHADRTDADLMKAIAIAFGVAAVYLIARTMLVVEVCSG
jgi:hypothetical protein